MKQLQIADGIVCRPYKAAASHHARAYLHASVKPLNREPSTPQSHKPAEVSSRHVAVHKRKGCRRETCILCIFPRTQVQRRELCQSRVLTNIGIFVPSSAPRRLHTE